MDGVIDLCQQRQPNRLLNRTKRRFSVSRRSWSRLLFPQTIERIKNKTSVAQMTRSMAYHPGVQQAIADIVIEVEGIAAHADRIAEDWTNDVDHGAMWPAKLVAAKYHCV